MILDAVALLLRALDEYYGYVRLSAYVYFGSWLLGLLLLFNEPAADVLVRVLELVFGGGDASNGADLTVRGLFVHNLRVSLMLAGGFLSLGFLTLALLVLNGLMHAMIILGTAVLVGPPFVFVLVLPHAVFEIPAILLAGAVGFGLSHRLVQGMERDDLVHAGVLLVVVTLLLGIAAVVEVHVSGAIGEDVAEDLLPPG